VVLFVLPQQIPKGLKKIGGHDKPPATGKRKKEAKNSKKEEMNI